MKKRMKSVLCRVGIHDDRDILVTTHLSPKIFIKACVNCGREKKEKK